MIYNVKKLRKILYLCATRIYTKEEKYFDFSEKKGITTSAVCKEINFAHISIIFALTITKYLIVTKVHNLELLFVQ